MNEIVQADAQQLANNNLIPWNHYENKDIIITGATGLLGQNMAQALLSRIKVAHESGRVLLLVRNIEKAKQMFEESKQLLIAPWDASDERAILPDGFVPSFIFHCANPTDSAGFTHQPVETIDTTVGGARCMLNLANKIGASLCILSTMEIYGQMENNRLISEASGGFLDTMDVRNSYPEAKRLVECLAASYASEMGTDVKIARLTQTFGPGVGPSDRRVFAEFARCALEERDIVLLTDGSKRNSYLYTADAISALLYVCAHGKPGLAYNVANDATFCSILEMADLVANRIANSRIAVRVEIDDVAAKRFRKGSVINLDTTRLRNLGWRPRVGLVEMYERMIASWECGCG